jgi:hypothetical protein
MRKNVASALTVDPSKYKRYTFKYLTVAKNDYFSGCSRMPRCKAPEILRNEAYLEVRRNNEG